MTSEPSAVGVSVREHLSGGLTSRELELRNALLESILAACPYAVAMFDTELRYLFANARWLSDNKLDLSSDEIVGQSLYAMFPDMPEHCIKLHQRCLAGEASGNQVEAVLRDDGGVTWLRWEARPWMAANGAIGGILIFIEDVSEHWHAEGELRRWEYVFQHAPWGMSLSTPDNRFIAVNRAFARMHGGEPEAWVGRPLADMFADEAKPQLPMFERSLQRQGHIVYESEHVRADGSSFPALTDISEVKDVAGGVLFRAASLRDITEQRAASQALSESEARFRGTFENAAVGIAHVALDGRWLRVNDKLCSITGYSREFLLGIRFQEITHPDDLEADMAFVRQMIAGTISSYSMEKRYICSSGSSVWITLTVSFVRRPDGSPDYFIAIVEDIDRRKAAEAALRESERSRERARFFELSVDMVCIASKDGHFLHVNPAFSITLGYANAELIGHSFLELVHADERAAAHDALEKLASGAPSVGFTNRYQRKDGNYSWLQWRVAPEVDGRIYAVARDVTADRLMVAELREKQASLSASLKEREVLLQEVHHRVKNNLQVISSLIGLQLRLLQDGAAIASLEECRTRVEAMALIHETLYRARDYARVPFADYARTLAITVFHASGRSDVALEFDFQELALTVDRAIPSGLILNELMTNALKHAFPGERSGTIAVQLHRTDTHMELAVSDDGVGLPGELDPASADSLGMQLVTMLVEQLEGQLEVRSEHGASFRIKCALEAR